MLQTIDMKKGSLWLHWSRPKKQNKNKKNNNKKTVFASRTDIFVNLAQTQMSQQFFSEFMWRHTQMHKLVHSKTQEMVHGHCVV